MSANIRVTVFIPVRNGQNYIRDAIESVLSQTGVDFKLVIADNGSTDITRSIVSEYLVDDRVRLVAREKDLGCIQNFNRCLDTLDTEYYMILSHDDCLFDKHALKRGLDALDSNSEAVAVHSDMTFIDKIGRPIMRKKFGYSGLVDSDSVAKRSIVAGRNYFSIPLLIRSKSVGDLRFADDLPLSTDFDFSVALGLGKKIYHCNDALLAIRFHGSNNTARTFRELEKEFFCIARKHKIKLSLIDVIWMKINKYSVCFQKYLFFIYLDKFRRYGN